jgi:hypothetical protein
MGSCAFAREVGSRAALEQQFACDKFLSLETIKPDEALYQQWGNRRGRSKDFRPTFAWSIIICIILHSWSNHRERRMATLHRPPAGIRWDQPADLSNKSVARRLSLSAIKAFLKIVELWELRDADARQLLGGMSNGAFYELKKKGSRTLDQDRLTRISLLTGIFKALNILYRKKLADRWIQLLNTNPMFGGETPLAYMIKGGMPAMVRVRQLLDARRGGR